MSTERILKAVIKIAAVCLRAPATLAVASTLYMDFGLWRWVTAGAALVLVEGTAGLAASGQPGQDSYTWRRSLYATLVVVASVVLWAIALAHGEGLVGIAFRSPLGVLIAYSLAEAGILAGLRQDAAVLKDF